MLETMLQFEGGIEICESTLKRAQECAIDAIKKELPEEAHTYQVLKTIFDECITSIQSKKLVL